MKTTTKAAETKRLNRERAERIRAEQEKFRAIVRANVCPCCGSALRRNLSLSGWYQCEQYGSEGFRKDSSKPACSFQGFTGE